MRKQGKKSKYKDSPVSSTIEAARDRIYKADDPIKLAMIFFPNTKAKMKRASFLAIYYELRKAKDMKLQTLNHIPEEYNINKSVFTKARSKMLRIGLINKYGGMWTFSNAFENSMERLCEKLKVMRTDSTEKSDRYMEEMFIEAAKNLEVDKQWRLKKKK